MRGALLCASLALTVLGAVQAQAGEDASVRRGLKVVDQWCSMCHSIARREKDPDRAPTFAQIVRREGRDKAYFTTFLHEDHFPMTTFRLFEPEKRDVVAFLLWLQRKE